jgi:hypothetical protein
MWVGFWMNACWAVVFVSTTWAMREQGGLGLAGARAAAYALHLVWTYWYALRVLRK